MHIVLDEAGAERFTNSCIPIVKSGATPYLTWHELRLTANINQDVFKSIQKMILSHNKHALKEWAVNVESLRRGQQILLLRKGGIHEQRQGFSVEHKEFFLFPTYLHQNWQALHPSMQSQLESLLQKPCAERLIRFDTYAQVKYVAKIENVEALRELDGLHTLSWEAVRERFHYRDRPGLHLILLQVYRLPTPQWTENREIYEGCVSWVQLEDSLATKGAESVLPPAEFHAKAQDIRRLIGIGNKLLLG